MSSTFRTPLPFSRPTAHAVFAALLLVASTTVSAATITFLDDTFANGAWSATKIVDTTAGATASFTASQVASGGNPGNYRQVTHVYDAGDITVTHLASSATYDPSTSGAILSLAYSYDLIHINPPPNQAVAYAVVLQQGGAWYSTAAFDIIFPQTWTSFGLSGLTAGNFVLRAGTGPATPNFSASGGPMTFGYLSANSNSGGAPGLTRVSGIDNWRVQLTTVPLPASVWLLGTALSAVFVRVRRRGV